MFLEASKCLQTSGCKHSHQDLEWNLNRVLPSARSFVQQTAMELPAESVLWGIHEMRLFENKTDGKGKYFREEKRKNPNH